MTSSPLPPPPPPPPPTMPPAGGSESSSVPPLPTSPGLPSDGELIGAARERQPGAWEELVRRHGHVVSAVVTATSKRRSGQSKTVARALDAFHDELVESDPNLLDDGVRAVRPRMLSKLNGGVYGAGASVDASVEGLGTADQAELESIARAFSTLPASWQTALWHRVVEQQQSAEFAVLLGRSAGDVGAAVHRSEAGLFDAYLLDQRSESGVLEACVPVIPLLGGASRSVLSAADQQMLDEHADCPACERRRAVGRELSMLLPAAVVPGLTGMSVADYRIAARTEPTAVAAGGSGGRRRILAVAAVALVAAVAAVVLVNGVPGTSDTSDNDAAPSTAAPTSPVATEASATTAEPTSTAAATVPAPTTTELLLRPAIDGPRNVIDVVFDEPIAGFAPVSSDLSVVLASPGPVFAGGTGTIDLLLTNVGAVDLQTTATLQVPRGIVFDALVDGAATCTDPVDDSARCDIAVSADSTERVTVRFRLQSSNVGGLVVASNLAAEDLEVPITAVPRLVHSSVNEGRIIVAGNTLMTCVETDPACVDARDGVGEIVNRWDLPAQFVNIESESGWLNSSSATIDLGGGGVEAAYLFWSGDLSQGEISIPNDGRVEQITFLPPGASQPVEITAERVRLGDVDASQYFGSVDVTDLVKFFGPGEYTFGNVESVETQGSYAGWAMVVVTDEPSLPRRSNVVISPFTWFSPDDTYAVEIDVLPERAVATEVGVIAFEGERGFVEERLQIGDEVLGEAGFDSSIIGERNPSYDNNFGTDVDAYDLVIDASDGTLPILATSDNDGVRLAVIALAFDVE